MAQAIEQRKKELFTQWKQKEEATGKLTTVSLDDIVMELQKARDEAAKNLLNKKPVQYIDNKIAILKEKGSTTLDEASKTIQDLNAELKSYYRNPTTESAITASIDALIANRLRKALDDTITISQGPGYSALKKEYGALSKIEPEVAKRAVVASRKSPA